MSLIIKKQSFYFIDESVYPPSDNDYILISTYITLKNEYEINCKYKSLLFQMYFFTHLVKYSEAYLQKLDNHYIYFYNDNNTIIHKELQINYDNMIYSYKSNIPIMKYLYNIYSLYKYLLLLKYYSKHYEFHLDLDLDYNINTNKISRKKFLNCMRLYKNILYILRGNYTFKRSIYACKVQYI